MYSAQYLHKSDTHLLRMRMGSIHLKGMSGRLNVITELL